LTSRQASRRRVPLESNLPSRDPLAPVKPLFGVARGSHPSPNTRLSPFSSRIYGVFFFFFYFELSFATVQHRRIRLFSPPRLKDDSSLRSFFCLPPFFEGQSDLALQKKEGTIFSPFVKEVPHFPPLGMFPPLANRRQVRHLPASLPLFSSYSSVAVSSLPFFFFFRLYFLSSPCGGLAADTFFFGQSWGTSRCPLFLRTETTIPFLVPLLSLSPPRCGINCLSFSHFIKPTPLCRFFRFLFFPSSSTLVFPPLAPEKCALPVSFFFFFLGF